MRRVVALLAAACFGLGVASATSFGTFTDVVLSGVEFAQDPCEAGSVHLLDLSGNRISLPASGAFTITGVEVTGLTGDCLGMRPQVVVDGYPSLVSTDDEVIGLQGFDPLSDTVDLVLDVDLTDPLASLLDATQVATNVRVTFCPQNYACT